MKQGAIQQTKQSNGQHLPKQYESTPLAITKMKICYKHCIGKRLV